MCIRDRPRSIKSSFRNDTQTLGSFSANTPTKGEISSNRQGLDVYKRQRATRFITQLLRLNHKNSVNRPQKKINSRFTYIITLLQMYHQSRVSGKSEAAFVIRRRTHNALSIITEMCIRDSPTNASLWQTDCRKYNRHNHFESVEIGRAHV